MDRRLKPESKRKIIRCADAVLQRDGVELFSVRRVADECGCAPANLYRHFEGKDELLLYATLRHLIPYLSELYHIWTTERDCIQTYFSFKQCFAKYAFAEPLLYYNLHFGQASDRMPKIMENSIELFPEIYRPLLPDDLHHYLILPGGIAARHLAVLERCRQCGYITLSPEELRVFNDGMIHLYRGFLDRAAALERVGSDTSFLIQEYSEIHRVLHQPVFTVDFPDLFPAS